MRSTVVAVAVARELAGWCWSLAVMDELGPRTMALGEESAPAGRLTPRGAMRDTAMSSPAGHARS